MTRKSNWRVVVCHGVSGYAMIPGMGTNIGATETATRLGVSVRTLDRMEKDGRLAPVSRIGRRRKYDAQQVERVRIGLPAEDAQAQR